MKWEWNNTEYLGAAHGYGGIMYFIIHFWDSVDQLRFKLENDNIKQFLEQFGFGKEAIWKLLINTIEYCLSFRLEDEDSINIPASIDDRKDRGELVHWCHGAPGWIPLLAHPLIQD